MVASAAIDMLDPQQPDPAPLEIGLADAETAQHGQHVEPAVPGGDQAEDVVPAAADNPVQLVAARVLPGEAEPVGDQVALELAQRGVQQPRRGHVRPGSRRDPRGLRLRGQVHRGRPVRDRG